MQNFLCENVGPYKILVPFLFLGECKCSSCILKHTEKEKNIFQGFYFVQNVFFLYV